MGTWVDRLTRQYRAGKKELIAYRMTLDREDPAVQEESDIVGGMINELQRSINWMQLGSEPGSVRGTQATDAYRYAELRDMDLLPALDLRVADPESNISDEQKRKIIRVLLKLSVRERQCYLLHTVQGLSFAKIGDELGISRNTVRTFVERAKTKTRKGL